MWGVGVVMENVEELQKVEELEKEGRGGEGRTPRARRE